MHCGRLSVMSAPISLAQWNQETTAIHSNVLNPNAERLCQFDRSWRFWPGSPRHQPVEERNFKEFRGELATKVAGWEEFCEGLRPYDSIKIPCEAQLAYLQNQLGSRPPLRAFFTRSISHLQEKLDCDQTTFDQTWEQCKKQFEEVSSLTQVCLEKKTSEARQRLANSLATANLHTKQIRNELLRDRKQHEALWMQVSDFGPALANAGVVLMNPAIERVGFVDLLDPHNPDRRVTFSKAEYGVKQLGNLWRSYSEAVVGNEGWLWGKKLFLDRCISGVTRLQRYYSDGLKAAFHFQSARPTAKRPRIGEGPQHV